MSQEIEMNLFDEIWNNAEALAEAAADLEEKIEAEYGYPATDNRAKSEKHRSMSAQYFQLWNRSQALADGARALIFDNEEGDDAE